MRRRLSAERTAEVLDHLDLLDDYRVPALRRTGLRPGTVVALVTTPDG
ncbi:MAG: hypothetical protein ACRDR6_14810 [Pseudonocardiaceae bacterium]